MATLQKPKLYPRPEIDKMTKKQVEAALGQFLRQESPDDYGARLDRRKVQPWRDALWVTQQKWQEARDQATGTHLSIFDLLALSPAPEEEKPESEDCDSSAPIADDFLSASGGDMSAPPYEVGADDQSKKPSVAEPQLKIDPLVELSPEELQQAQSLEAIRFSYVGDAEEFYPWEVELGVVGSWRFGSPQPEAGYLDARCRRALYSKCDDFDPDVDLDAFFDSEIETAKRAILSTGVKGGTAGSCTKSLPAASFAENSAQSAQTETEGSFDTELAAFVGEPPAIPQTAPLPPLPPVPPEAPATPDEDEEDMIVRGGLFGEHSANIVPLLKPEPSTETGVGKIEAKPLVEERAGAGAGNVEPVGTSVSEPESKLLVDKEEIVRQIQAFWFQKRWDRKACECWIFEVLGVGALSSLSQLQLERLLILAVAAGIPVPRCQPCYTPESQPPTRGSAGVDVGKVEPELPVEEGVGVGDAEPEPGVEEGVGVGDAEPEPGVEEGVSARTQLKLSGESGMQLPEVSPVALPVRNISPMQENTAPEMLAEKPASAGDNKELAQHQILRQLGYTEASALRSPAVFFGEASGWKLGYTCSILDPSCVLLDAESSTGKVFSLCLEGVEGERIVVAKKELESVQQALLAIESCSGAFHARLSEKTPQSSRHRWDFYQSPVWYGLVAIRELPLSGTVLEPCAGDGAIASVLSAVGLRVLTNDLNPALATNFHVDATGDWGTFPYVDWVITTPP